MQYKKLFSSVIFVLLFFTLTSCATTGRFSKTELVTVPEVYDESELMSSFRDWSEVVEGFSICSGKLQKQRVQWHCIRIDLDTPFLYFISLPQKNSLGKTFFLKDFAKKNHTIAAINTSPFDLYGKTYIPEGITKLDNQIVTEPLAKYCALCFKRNVEGLWRAKIIPSQTEEALKDCEYAFGGFFSVLENRELVPFAKNRRSRTACGINDDGSVLYLFVTTPKLYPSDRNGLNFEECAIILRKLGCKDAMQFDGGHSSGMYLFKKAVERPMFQRKVPVALGFLKKAGKQ